jgi:hypothetical protein
MTVGTQVLMVMVEREAEEATPAGDEVELGLT